MFKELVLSGTLLIYCAAASAQTVTPDKNKDTAKDRATGQQSSGFITGTILDQTGAVAAGVHVRLTRDGQSASQEVVSGGNGQFSFSNVPPGAFRLTVSSANFATRVFSGNLRPSQGYIVPAIVLALPTAKTEVTVGLPTVEVAEKQIKEQEKQRVLGFIPNFFVSYVPDAAPLNWKQKFRLAWKVSVDPVTFVGVGALAGIRQAGDSPSGYGQGAEGYAKRFGAEYGNVVTAIYVGNAILPSVLKQDPRYFYKGTGTTKSRILYALSSSVICKGDNKRWQPNYSNIGGSIATGAISNLYFPPGDRTGAGLVFVNALIRLGQGSLGAVMQEFVVPRLTPHLRQHKLANQKEP